MPTPSAPRHTNVRWSIFSLACATSALLYLHRYAFSFMKPALAKEWSLNKAQLGELDSAFFACYTLFQLPFGLLADGIGVHLVLVGLMVLWCIGLGLVAWAPS